MLFMGNGGCNGQLAEFILFVIREFPSYDHSSQTTEMVDALEPFPQKGKRTRDRKTNTSFPRMKGAQCPARARQGLSRNASIK